MPWTADQLRHKGARYRFSLAAKMANAILKRTGNEGEAIATALKHVNMHRRRRPMRGEIK